MIQLLFLAMISRWRPHRDRWRQKRIIGMTKKVPVALRLCSLCRCSISDPHEFANRAWPWVRIFAKSFGILPLTLLIALDQLTYRVHFESLSWDLFFLININYISSSLETNDYCIIITFIGISGRKWKQYFGEFSVCLLGFWFRKRAWRLVQRRLHVSRDDWRWSKSLSLWSSHQFCRADCKLSYYNQRTFIRVY